MALVCVTDSGGLDVEPGVARLRGAGHEVVVLEARLGAEVVAAAAGAEALVVSFTPVDAATIAALPRLRVVATTTVGLDQVDVDAATAAGVAVRPLPGLAAEEVACQALAGMLALLRELPAAQAAAAAWDFTRIPAPPRISELTLGIFGMGAIARQLVARTAALFGDVVAYDPHAPADGWPAGVRRVDAPAALFSAAHVISLHAPATPETRHVVDATALALMPEPRYVVNVARGELVDHAALLAALDAGAVRGAFLDVTEPEPPGADSPLLTHPRVVLTPHAGFYSTATERAYVMTAVEQAIAALAKPDPTHTEEPPR